MHTKNKISHVGDNAIKMQKDDIATNNTLVKKVKFLRYILGILRIAWWYISCIIYPICMNGTYTINNWS